MVATIPRLLSPEALAKRTPILEQLFATGTHRAVLVLGYSWSDAFDVRPVLSRLADRVKEVIYVDHPPGQAQERLRQTFATIHVQRVVCDTDEIVRSVWRRLLKADYVPPRTTM